MLDLSYLRKPRLNTSILCLLVLHVSNMMIYMSQEGAHYQMYWHVKWRNKWLNTVECFCHSLLHYTVIMIAQLICCQIYAVTSCSDVKISQIVCNKETMHSMAPWIWKQVIKQHAGRFHKSNSHLKVYYQHFWIRWVQGHVKEYRSTLAKKLNNVRVETWYWIWSVYWIQGWLNFPERAKERSCSLQRYSQTRRLLNS